MEVRDGLAAVLAEPYLPLRAGAEPAWLEIAEASAGRSWSRSSGRRATADRLATIGKSSLMLAARARRGRSAACRAAFQAVGHGISHCVLPGLGTGQGRTHRGARAGPGTRLKCKGLITPFVQSCSAVSRMGSFAWERFFLAAHLHSHAQGRRLTVTCVLAEKAIAVFAASVNSGNSGPAFKRGITMRQKYSTFRLLPAPPAIWVHHVCDRARHVGDRAAVSCSGGQQQSAADHRDDLQPVSGQRADRSNQRHDPRAVPGGSGRRLRRGAKDKLPRTSAGDRRGSAIGRARSDRPARGRAVADRPRVRFVPAAAPGDRFL